MPSDLPVYALKVGSVWKVIVPIRGWLAPKQCATEFATKEAAEAWTLSDEASVIIARMRTSSERGVTKHRNGI